MAIQFSSSLLPLPSLDPPPLLKLPPPHAANPVMFENVGLATEAFL
jgi:hypothetical protein